jgi:hypothetical protein
MLLLKGQTLVLWGWQKIKNWSTGRALSSQGGWDWRESSQEAINQNDCIQDAESLESGNKTTLS